MNPLIEEVEKSCLRLVVRAIRDYYTAATKIFLEETDLASDVEEDVTREAINVALMIDSKAEKDGNTATIQMSQTSMQIRQLRAGKVVAIDGILPTLIKRGEVTLQTVTIVVKYVYENLPLGYLLKKIKIACIPSGVFQDRYNPNDQDSIWMVGRNAPTLDEEFRVRLSFSKLAAKSPWRVIEIQGT